ncbi:MAG: Flp family type IVb pilin [Bacillota bacterium]
MKRVRRIVSEDVGQSMGEYALILALVAVGAILVFTNLGTAIQNKVQQLITAIGG